MFKNKYSVIIAGSGISGLYTALKLEQLANLPNGILLVTKNKLHDSNSYYAQGGMVAVLNENSADSNELHISDTIKAGAGLCERETAKFISENSNNIVEDLLKFGVEFDRNSDGKFALTKEAAHSVNRILHCCGDATGREMELALCDAVKNNQSITVLEDAMVVELLNESGKCCGVKILDNNKFKNIYSDVVVLATGGVGQLYKYTTNPAGATGDGIALAYNAGAILRDMEFLQFHPTALAIDDKKNKNRFLISESVRGEGAKLCDKKGKEYMQNYHEKRELAPRDVVARANFLEMQKNKVSNVWLDATVIGVEKLAKRFPTISKKCLENGIDITKDLIPVAPAAHYFMGGIKTDIHGRTSLEGLYAVGEVSSTGLHGANRLASNSLLECVVCAFEVANSLKEVNFTKGNCEFNSDEISENTSVHHKNVQKYKDELKEVMWTYAGILRDENSLKTALEKVKNIKEDFSGEMVYDKDGYELLNMLTVAQIIIKSALNRRESRGAHYRTDYKMTNNECKHTLIKKEKGEICFVE